MHGQGNLLVTTPEAEPHTRTLPVTLTMESTLSNYSIRVSTLQIDSQALQLFSSGTIDLRIPELSVKYDVTSQDISTIMKQILVFIPGLQGVIVLVASVWTLVAMVIAVRQALDFTTGRAVATCLIAFVIVTIIAMLAGPMLVGSGA